jgi:hypothetical protein
MSLAVFDVSKFVDPATGKEIGAEYIPLPGTVRCEQLFFPFVDDAFQNGFIL